VHSLAGHHLAICSLGNILYANLPMDWVSTKISLASDQPCVIESKVLAFKIKKLLFSHQLIAFPPFYDNSNKACHL